MKDYPNEKKRVDAHRYQHGFFFDTLHNKEIGMQKRMIYLICIQILILGFTLIAQAGMESENYRITTSVFSGGGLPMDSDSYAINATLGFAQK